MTYFQFPGLLPSVTFNPKHGGAEGGLAGPGTPHPSLTGTTPLLLRPAVFPAWSATSHLGTTGLQSL